MSAEEHARSADNSAALSSPRCPGPLCVGWPALCPAGAGRHPETETSSPSPAGAPASHAGSDGAAPPGPPAAVSRDFTFSSSSASSLPTTESEH